MTHHVGVLYIENDTELSWLIGSGVDCDETKLNNYVIDLTDVVYKKIEIELSSLIELGMVYDKN